MNRKRARFDVVGIEITVHCPHCDSPVKSPLFNSGLNFIWTAAAILETAGKDVKCNSCRRWFRLSYELRKLLQPSAGPVSPDRRVSAIAHMPIICANCAGDATEPKRTLLTTDGRCSDCGGSNYTLAAKLQNQNGKENSDDAN